MAVYSHKKKVNKRTWRMLLAAVLWIVPAALFVCLARASYFRALPAQAEAPRPTADISMVREPPVVDELRVTEEPVSPPDLSPEPSPEASPEPSPEPSPDPSEEPSEEPGGGEAEPAESPVPSGAPGFIPPEKTQCIFMDGSGNPLSDYKWGDTIPASEAVDDDFFSDSVFIGNSLAQGFMLYSGLKTPDYFATQSISVMNIYYEKAINKGGGVYVTILDAMSQKEYSKVYIELGINEISLSDEDFYTRYGKLIDRIRELQPKAAIYLQSMTPVTAAQSESGSVFNNKRVRRYNELIKDLAAEKEAHYLDVYSSMANENGDLPAGGAFDGIHPYSKYYKAWREYLQTHTVLEVKP